MHRPTSRCQEVAAECISLLILLMTHFGLIFAHFWQQYIAYCHRFVISPLPCQIPLSSPSYCCAAVPAPNNLMHQMDTTHSKFSPVDISLRKKGSLGKGSWKGDRLFPKLNCKNGGKSSDRFFCHPTISPY